MRLLSKAGFGLALLTAMLAIAPAAKADPIVIQSGGFALHNLGNNGTVANGLDSLIGSAASGTRVVNGTGSFFALLNPVTFRTGFTGHGSEGSYDFNISQLLTINGQTRALNLAGNIEIGTYVDSVRILSSSPLTFRFNGFSVDVTVLPAEISAGTDAVLCDVLKARFTVRNDCNPVPEPATLSLLGIGIAGLAAKFRSRRRPRN